MTTPQKLPPPDSINHTHKPESIAEWHAGDRSIRAHADFVEIGDRESDEYDILTPETATTLGLALLAAAKHAEGTTP